MTRIKADVKSKVRIEAGVKSKPSLGVTIHNGVRGKSAYQIWLDEGNVGTKEDFLESLKATHIQLDYTQLYSKPSIEMIELTGDKSFKELGIVSIENKEIGNIF